MDIITIAILAKDKEYCLPEFLQCIKNLNYPKDKIMLYIRTNDNKDNTALILKTWLDNNGKLYNKVYYNEDSINKNVKKFGKHEWVPIRFKVLAKIREESIQFAIDNGTHYFVVDCDNFVTEKNMLKILMDTNLGVVAPMLPIFQHNYANFHFKCDSLGYFNSNDRTYYDIRDYKIYGLIVCDVIHCTYLIRNEYLKYVKYSDDTDRHEYVIFSEILRKNKINQYLDNRDFYGYLTLLENRDDLQNELWFKTLFPPGFVEDVYHIASTTETPDSSSESDDTSSSSDDDDDKVDV